jgi:methionyl-tRNA synthetase
VLSAEPASGAGRFYVTTPIYYVNAIPHLGHSYATVNADALARWHRMRGDAVHFLTGTDEHGLKIQLAAEAQGVTPQEWSDQIAEQFAAAWRLLNISNDDFIRTTEPRHRESVQWLLQRVYDNGFVEKGTYEGLYCVGCEAYYKADELITNNDGVENCCPIHKRAVQTMTEENYFFKLSAFEDRLLAWLDATPDAVIPTGKRNEVLGFIKGGLQDFSISRSSITWGIPLPWDESHVTYVWFDALTNYLSALGLGRDNTGSAAADSANGVTQVDRWWPNVRHIVGKDILRFHCVYWPAMLMAAGIEPPSVLVHGFLLIGGEKLSKTGLVQIYPQDLCDEFGVDAVRYHLLREVPLGNDGEFSHEGMVARFNTDLANNFGNLAARVATVVAKKCDGIGPAPRADSPLAAVATACANDAAQAWTALSPSDALDATWRLIRETNSHLEDNQPWKSEPGPEVDAVMGDALEALRIIAILSNPAMPTICQALWERIGCLGLVADQRVPDALVWGGYVGGQPVVKGDVLFPRKS